MKGETVRFFLWSFILIGVIVGCSDDPAKPAESLPSTSVSTSATNTPTPPATSTPMPVPTATPTLTPTPKASLNPGTYQVGVDIQQGVYAGKTGTGMLDTCYWERLSGVSGEIDDIVANDNAIGQFYVEVLPSDKYFKVDCEITPIKKWLSPKELISEVEPGTYLVGRDIAPGTYRGEAGTGILDACYWERLSGVSGEFDEIIANENATGQFFVSVFDADYALSTSCDLELVEMAPKPTATLTHVPMFTAAPTTTPEPTWTPGPTFTPEPTSTPTSTTTPKPGLGPGTYQVNIDMQPGVYAGKTGTGLLDTCYWERLSGVSGDFSDIIANDNAIGQFYVEILSTDKYFKVDCDIIPLDEWPSPDDPLAKLDAGTYLVGQDIAPGTYRGEAGTAILDACYWERLSGVSGEFDDVIANENATGQFFVNVIDTDYALSTTCALELVEP